MTPDELARDLHGIASELGDLTAPNREAADLVLAAARPPRRTGRLAGSLYVDADAFGGAVVSDLVYAPVIHNGWPARNIAAQPFLADALDAITPDVVDTFTEHLIDIIRSA